MNDYDVINAYYQLLFNNSRYFILDYLFDGNRRAIIKEWLPSMTSIWISWMK